jgi:ferredoxin
VGVTVVVDAAKCMSNGLCESIAPGLLEVGEDAVAHAVAQPRSATDIDAARRAAATCPMSAILLEEQT